MKAEFRLPYKGPESYQTHDRGLFFGRDIVAQNLVSQVLSSRFTVLHAQSGAGKTSLLNAELIPGLERRGWAAVRALPHHDPIAAMRATTLESVLPPPAVELAALDRALAALFPGEDDIALDALLARYDKLDAAAPVRRMLVSPIAVVDLERPFRPLFCRVLRNTLDVDGFARHVGVIAGGRSGKARAWTGRPISGADTTSCGRLREWLASPELTASHTELVAAVDCPIAGLWPFFESLFQVYGYPAKLTLVLILDQFEELFTRFVDRSPCPRRHDEPDWRLRPKLFDELKRLWQTMGDAASTVLPLRFVISLRDEYVAPLRRELVPDIEQHAFHLGLLNVADAEIAIRKPAEIFGHPYSEGCYQRILSELSKEEKYVEPAHLQIVCQKLWRTQTEDTVDGARSRADFETLAKLGGSQGILRSFLSEILDDLPEADRLESLEMLQELVTESGTRNILHRNVLLDEKFRIRARREKLLDLLVARTIVRVEPRLGGEFVEITHEFLIGPVLEYARSMLAASPRYRAFRAALRTLQALARQRGSIGAAAVLHADDVRALHEQHDRLEWDAWSTELLLRCAIALQIPDVMQLWLHRFSCLAGQDSLLAIEDWVKAPESSELTLRELRHLNLRRALFDSCDAAKRRAMMKGYLMWGRDEDREALVFWTRAVDGAREEIRR